MEDSLALKIDFQKPSVDFHIALLAGGLAGLSVDIILYPLDTIKTRLQSHQGFLAAGGFRGIYSGLMSAALGSAPAAALFFCSYETTKNLFHLGMNGMWAPVGHMMAASVGEVAACLVRVPVEVVKQRTQATPNLSSLAIFKHTVGSEGIRGLYRGFASTVARDAPFALIQFPLWEFFKMQWSARTKQPIEAWQSSLCGAFAGGLAAGLTTPLDVVKTRIILAKKDSSTAHGSIYLVMKQVYGERGIKGLFSGSIPRIMWISIGGAIFLGVYDKARYLLQNVLSA